MLITTAVDSSGSVNMDAYSNSVQEFVALEETLRAAGLIPAYTSIGRDSSGREGRQYTATRPELAALQNVLGGQFDSRGHFTPTAGLGTVYACRQVLLGGAGSGCQELIAPSDYIATAICALIAGSNGWYGGVAQPGKCAAPKKGLRGVFSR